MQASHLRALSTLLVLGVALGCVPLPAVAANWRWFGSCDCSEQMELEVRLDDTVVYSTSVPICRTDVQDARRLSFHFKAPRSIAWSGYRDDVPTTRSGDQITVDVWQAGGEEDALILGVSAVLNKTILMNTLHIASSAKSVTSEIEPGFSVTTRPLRPGKSVH